MQEQKKKGQDHFVCIMSTVLLEQDVTQYLVLRIYVRG